MDNDAIYRARALVLADLSAESRSTPDVVSLLEEACSARRWWLDQWPDGATYLPGLIAQDLQDRLADDFGRDTMDGLWPVCRACSDGPVHVLRIDPDLGGPDPSWVCEETHTAIAPLGSLASAD